MPVDLQVEDTILAAILKEIDRVFWSLAEQGIV
jgi:hypothetical protein